MSDSTPTVRTIKARIVTRSTPVDEPETVKVRFVTCEGGDDLTSYRERLAAQFRQLPRRETVFEQLERERAEERG